MSHNLKSKSVEAAAHYNSKTKYVFPEYVLTTFPALRSARSSVDFAWEIVRLQLYVLGMTNVDGMLGRLTYQAILRHCMPINSEYVVRDGCRISLPSRSEYSLVSFDEPAGLDLHRYGKFSSRERGAISGVTLHWGGLDAQNCFSFMSGDVAQVSTHFLIGKTGPTEVTVYQVLDLNHKAWHAGPVNEFTVGIDICQSAETMWLDHYMSKQCGKYEVSKIKNTTGRGPASVLSLDPYLARATSVFVMDLCSALGIPCVYPDTHKVYPDLTKFGVFGHHHVSERKYDMACWWSSIFRNSCV